MCTKFWQTYRASYAINIQCKRSKLGIYFRVRSVLVKLQPPFQSLRQVEDSSNQSPGSKQTWNSFVRTSSKYSSSVPICGTRKRIRPNTIIYLYISFQRSSLNVSPRIFRICPSIHAPSLSLSLSSYSHVSILDRMIENREREKEVRKSIGGRSRRGQACAQFHGKILIEDNRS